MHKHKCTREGGRACCQCPSSQCLCCDRCSGGLAVHRCFFSIITPPPYQQKTKPLEILQKLHVHVVAGHTGTTIPLASPCNLEYVEEALEDQETWSATSVARREGSQRKNEKEHCSVTTVADGLGAKAASGFKSVDGAHFYWAHEKWPLHTLLLSLPRSATWQVMVVERQGQYKCVCVCVCMFVWVCEWDGLAQRIPMEVVACPTSVSEGSVCIGLWNVVCLSCCVMK